MAIAMTMAVGCGKKPEPAAPAPTETKSTSVASVLESGTPAKPETPPAGATAAAPAPVETPASAPTDKLPTAAPDSGKTGIQTPSAIKVTEAMQRFLERNNRLPRDFNELVTAKMLPSIPPAPPGKKYALDRKTLQVMVVDQ